MTSKKVAKRHKKAKGRPPKLSQTMVDQICIYVENGNTNKDACLMAGVTEAAFYNWQARGRRLIENKSRKRPDNSIFFYLIESLKKAEAKFRAYHISNINDASKKEWQASAWMLERRYPKEFGRRAVQIDVPVASESEAQETVHIYIPDNGRD